MVVQVEISTWKELREMVWSSARDVVLEIEKQGREEEAFDILEDIFDPDFYRRVSIGGNIPTDTDINDYIVFDLADHMNLYGDEDEEDEDDE